MARWHQRDLPLWVLAMAAVTILSLIATIAKHFLLIARAGSFGVGSEHGERTLRAPEGCIDHHTIDRYTIAHAAVGFVMGVARAPMVACCEHSRRMGSH